MSFLFGLSFGAGGIVNAYYSADNAQLNDELRVCASNYEDYSITVANEPGPDTCQHLSTIAAFEGASAVS